MMVSGKVSGNLLTEMEIVGHSQLGITITLKRLQADPKHHLKFMLCNFELKIPENLYTVISDYQTWLNLPFTTH